MKRGTEIVLEVERFGDRGKSIAKHDGLVVFVNGGVPGDRIRAMVTRKKRQYAEARMIELLTPGANRIQPRCAHFGVCGRCKWQHVEYEAQLAAKRESVADAFRQIARLHDVQVETCVPADPTFAYRNKMEFSFSAMRWLTEAEIASQKELDRSFALGLHVPGNFEKVLDLKECHLMQPWVSRLINELRSLARESGWPAWNIRSHEGDLRHLVVRVSHAFEEAMVNLVVASPDPDRDGAVAALLRDRFPEVTTFVVTVNTAVSQTSYGETSRVFGPGTIRDQIGAYQFQITPSAFFQTNTRQAARLYDLVVELADFAPSDTVFDLYSGAGTITLFVSSHVGSVVGVEVVAESVAAAKENAAENGVANVVFEEGDMLHHFDADLVSRHGHPDVVIVDPPRAGLHPKVVDRLGRLSPGRIVYVSCNPRTMARDIEMLLPTYTVDRVRPVDMFPHTYHTEAVARLTRS